MSNSQIITNPNIKEPRIGVYVCSCGLNIGKIVDCPMVAKEAAKFKNVIISKNMPYSCSEPGQKIIKNDIEDHNLNRIVIASCSPRLHETTFRLMLKSAGLNPYLMDMANIREHCSWVHKNNPQEATKKAIDLVKMSVARVRNLGPLEEQVLPLIKKTMVIGGGIAGIQAALDLADNGYEVIMVEKNPSIGGVMAQIDKTFPTIDCSI